MAVLGLCSWLAAWSIFLIGSADVDGELGVVRASIVVQALEGDDWLREYPGDLEMDLAPEEFALRAGARLIAKGMDPAALDPARIGWLSRWRPRVVAHVEDGVALARVVAAMDVLDEAGFVVAFEAEPP